MFYEGFAILVASVRGEHGKKYLISQDTASEIIVLQKDCGENGIKDIMTFAGVRIMEKSAVESPDFLMMCDSEAEDLGELAFQMFHKDATSRPHDYSTGRIVYSPNALIHDRELFEELTPKVLKEAIETLLKEWKSGKFPAAKKDSAPVYFAYIGADGEAGKIRCNDVCFFNDELLRKKIEDSGAFDVFQCKPDLTMGEECFVALMCFDKD